MALTVDWSKFGNVKHASKDNQKMSNQDRNGYKFSGIISLSNVMAPAERLKDNKDQVRMSLGHFEKVALYRMLGLTSSGKGDVSNGLEAYFLTPENVSALVESAYQANEMLRPTAEDLASYAKWLESKPVVDSEGSQVSEASNAIAASFAAMPQSTWDGIKPALDAETVNAVEMLRAKLANVETAKPAEPGKGKRGRKSALQTLASKADIVRKRNASASTKAVPATK